VCWTSTVLHRGCLGNRTQKLGIETGGDLSHHDSPMMGAYPIWIWHSPHSRRLSSDHTFLATPQETDGHSDAVRGLRMCCVVQEPHEEDREKVLQPARTLTVMEAASLDADLEAALLRPYHTPCIFAMMAA